MVPIDITIGAKVKDTKHANIGACKEDGIHKPIKDLETITVVGGFVANAEEDATTWVDGKMSKTKMAEGSGIAHGTN